MATAFQAFAARLLDIADGEADPASVANALGKLHRLAFFNSLPPAELRRVVAVARRHLANTDAPIVWLAAVELAVTTGDDELRAIVAGFASGEIRAAVTDRIDLGLWVRSAAQRALSRADDFSRAVGLA